MRDTPHDQNPETTFGAPLQQRRVLSVCIMVLLLAGSGHLIACAAAPGTDSPGELVGSIGTPDRSNQDRGQYDRRTLWYKITLGDASLDIHVRLYSPHDVTRFFLPSTWGGTDFSDRIRVAGARGPDGPRFMTIDRKNGHLEVEGADSEWIELHYRVDLTTSKEVPLVPRYTDGVLSTYGPAFLVLPAQQILDRTREIPVEVVLPSSWSVFSTWPQAHRQQSQEQPGHDVHGFVVPDSDILRDAFLVAGRFEIRELPDDVAVAFDPSFEGDIDAILEATHSTIVRLRRQYGNLGSTHVWVDARPTTAESAGGLGRSGGFVLELARNARLDASTALLISHEALHMWNGHHLVPDSSFESELRWFKEGVTHYLAIKDACHSPVFDMKSVLGELSRVSFNYLRNPVVHRTDVPARLDRLRFPYDFGVLFALTVDTYLMARNLGSIEDWIPTLETVLADLDQASYTPDALMASYRRLVNDDQRLVELWREHVRRESPIDIREAFDRIGLHYLPDHRGRSARLLALDQPSPQYQFMFESCLLEN